MKRLLITGLTTLSLLLLFVAVCVVWVCRRHRSYRASYAINTAEEEAGISLARSFIVSSAPGKLAFFTTPAWRDIRSAEFFGSSPMEFRGWGGSPAEKSCGLAGFRLYMLPNFLRAGRNGYAIVVPDLALAIVTSLLPLMWLRHRLRQRKVKTAGLCRACGYDLRATPLRCPECGAVPTLRIN